MPTKKPKREETNLEDVIDSFESWLERQTPKPVRAKHGYVADVKIEENQ